MFLSDIIKKYGVPSTHAAVRPENTIDAMWNIRHKKYGAIFSAGRTKFSKLPDYDHVSIGTVLFHTTDGRDVPNMQTVLFSIDPELGTSYRMLKDADIPTTSINNIVTGKYPYAVHVVEKLIKSYPVSPTYKSAQDALLFWAGFLGVDNNRRAFIDSTNPHSANLYRHFKTPLQVVFTALVEVSNEDTVTAALDGIIFKDPSIFRIQTEEAFFGRAGYLTATVDTFVDNLAKTDPKIFGEHVDELIELISHASHETWQMVHAEIPRYPVSILVHVNDEGLVEYYYNDMLGSPLAYSVQIGKPIPSFPSTAERIALVQASGMTTLVDDKPSDQPVIPLVTPLIPLSEAPTRAMVLQPGRRATDVIIPGEGDQPDVGVRSPIPPHAIVAQRLESSNTGIDDMATFMSIVKKYQLGEIISAEQMGQITQMFIK